MTIHNKVFGSTAIEAASYDDDSGELVITFNGRRGVGVYSFYGFPPNEWTRFTESHSAGSFYNTYIKGRYS